VTIPAAPSLVTQNLTEVPWSRLAGVRVGIVLWGGLAVVDVGRVTGVPAYVELGALSLLVVATSFRMQPTTAATAALVAWLVFNGFVIHRLGRLGFDGTPDLARLGLMLGLAWSAARARR
jgi:hypothetical protein